VLWGVARGWSFGVAHHAGMALSVNPLAFMFFFQSPF
jgi:hypothetical protein